MPVMTADQLVENASACMDQGMVDRALVMVERALSIDHDNPDLLVKKALVLNAMGRSTDALACCTRGLEKLPRDPSLLAVSATALCGLGRYKEAKKREDMARDIWLEVDD